jgi:hypothetical protein
METSLQTPLVDDDAIQSIVFFNGRLLSGEDLSQEQIAVQQRLCRLGESVGCGIVCGLEVGLKPAAAGDAEAKSKPTLTVKKGLALNQCGQTVRLGADVEVRLVRSRDAGAAVNNVFDCCKPLKEGSRLSGDGVYVFTIAPASERKGRAPVNGISSDAARCNSKYSVEAVQFNLVELDIPESALQPATDARIRNRVAYACFGVGEVDGFPTQPLDPDFPKYGLLDKLRPDTLTGCQVPLAILHWTSADGIRFIDLWSARRRVHQPHSGEYFSWTISARRRAEGEAMLLQFQEQMAAISQEAIAHSALKAESRFAFLPPAGFLRVGGGGFDWKTFLGPHATTMEVPLAPGLAGAVVQRSFGHDAIAVVSSANAASANPPPAKFNVYRVAGHPNYVMFARSTLAEEVAHDVWFDNSICKFPGVDNVQDAIDALFNEFHGCCTLVVRPEPGWEKIFDRIPNGKDAEICFQAGTFSTSAPVFVRQKGHLRIVGSGKASQIVASKSEAAIVFENCSSVSVAHLSAQSGAVGHKKSESSHLNGALTFLNCPHVDADAISASGPAGAFRGGTCLTVRNADNSPAQSVSVRNCDFLTGHQQIGLLILNANRVHVENNQLGGGATIAPSDIMLNAESRSQVRKMVLSRASNTTFSGAFKINDDLFIRTARALESEWTTAIAGFDAAIRTDPAKLLSAVEDLADKVVTEGKFRTGGVDVRSLAAGSSSGKTPAQPAQGIVVAGTVAGDVRILNNSVKDCAQGIRIGVSERDQTRQKIARAGSILVTGNRIDILLAAGSTRARHGILVGNCDSLVIERNYLAIRRLAGAENLPIEALRVFGWFGRRVFVRENHSAGSGDSKAFDVGIRFHALGTPTGKNPSLLWIIADNMFASSETRFKISPALQPLFRGLDTNSA